MPAHAPAPSRPGQIRIGISGWRYAPWRGVFYPPGLPQRRELEFASRMVSSIEINGSFYALQRPTFYAQWHDATPADFVFAVKGPKFITHVRRLDDVGVALANFLASGVFELKAKLGPVLWQFPPSLRFDAARFEAFFAQLPHDTAAAQAVARRHDAWLAGRASLAIDAPRPLRHAVEVRHASFATPEFVALLRQYRLALVVADTAGRWPLLEDLTADFVYVRLHGDQALYASGYDDAALDAWAARLAAWRDGRQVADARRASPVDAPPAPGRDVYCYFDNDVKVHAPYDAAALMRRLGQASALGERRTPAWPPGWQAPAVRQRMPAAAARGERSIPEPIPGAPAVARAHASP